MSRERLASGHEDEFSRMLLRSAETDEPSASAYAKAASALGVGVGVGASIAAPAALAAVRSSVFAGRVPATLLGKVMLFGVAGALLSGAVLFKVQRDRARAQPAPASVPKPAVLPPISAVRAAVVAAVRPAPGTLHAALTALHPPPAAPAVSASSSQSSSAKAALPAHHAPAPAPSSTLAEQVASLDRARVALNAGDSAAALREIAHYRGTWPHGVFLTEASVLEIEALAKRGERSLAASRARAFVAAHPDSPQAERLRALIEN